jgi:hypothetical protein
MSASAICAFVVQIGHGRKTFEQAKDELQRWEQFQLDWANVDSNTPLEKDSFVCVQAKPVPILPVWTAVPLKMMCVLIRATIPANSPSKCQEALKQSRFICILPSALYCCGSHDLRLANVPLTSAPHLSVIRRLCTHQGAKKRIRIADCATAPSYTASHTDHWCMTC